MPLRLNPLRIELTRVRPAAPPSDTNSYRCNTESTQGTLALALEENIGTEFDLTAEGHGFDFQARHPNFSLDC